MAATQSRRLPLVYTQAASPTTYDLVLRTDYDHQQLLTVKVDRSVNTATVATALAADAQKVAYIPNFNTIVGTALHVYAVNTGLQHVITDGPVAAAVWSTDSTCLAYALLDAMGAAQVLISDGQDAGVACATFNDLQSIALLGWSADGSTVYVLCHTGRADFPTPVFAHIAVATGQVTPIVTSDMHHYHDFRLVRMPNGDYISVIVSDTIWVAGGTSRLQLISVDGHISVEYGPTQHGYTSAVWSADGRSVTYYLHDGELASPEHDAATLEGVYLADVASGTAQQVLAGPLADYSLRVLDRDGLLLASPQRGLMEVTDALVLGDEPSVAPEVLGAVTMSLDVPYIHQLWGTAESFDGHWACGATSSAMAVAYCGRIPARPMLVLGNVSNFGAYVSNAYTYNTTTFNEASNDTSGHPAYGAYGFIVKGGLAQWDRITRYLRAHDLRVTEGDGNAGFDWVRQRLDEGQIIVTSGQVFGYGHITVICGYTDDGHLVLNDPYGDGTAVGWGKHNNGKGVIYSWQEISPKHFWAVRG